jgi:hypothetical protein
MKLLTQEILKKLPALYMNEDKSAAKVTIPVKFFNPMGSGTWYATEYDPEEGRFFGYASIFPGGGELGYFMLSELESVRLPFGLKIERDLHWDPKTTLQTVMDQERGR